MTRSPLSHLLSMVLFALASLALGCGLQGRGQLCAVDEDCDTARGLKCNLNKVCCPPSDNEKPECKPSQVQTTTSAASGAGGGASSSSGSGASGSGGASSSASSGESSSSGQSSSSSGESSSSGASSSSGSSM